MNIKMYADLKISENEYKSISVWDIINSYNDAKEQEYEGEFKDYYNENYKNLLFSTHKDINKKEEMHLCIREPYACSYFKYKYEKYSC